MITIRKKGMMTTIQDLGRIGYQRYGMPVCGAMDHYAMEQLSNGSHHSRQSVERCISTVTAFMAKLTSKYGGFMKLRKADLYTEKAVVLKKGKMVLSRMPEIACEWNGPKNGRLKPDKVTFRTGRLVWWRCGKGHSYRMSVYNRWQGKGCPYCSGTKVLSGFNDLRTVTPWIAEEWDDKRNGDLKPEYVFPYTNRKFWWKCENGHHWKSTVNSRQKGAGCPYCHGLIPRTPHFIS